jgi:hypothetical protein
MITAIVLPADMEQPIRQEQIEPADLDAYQRLVGGNLEVVNLDRPPASLYFNDEGKLLDLPVNPRATVVLWVHNSAFRGQDVIAGDAFIVGPVDRNANDRTVPEELVTLLFSTQRFRVLIRIEDDEQFYGNLTVFNDWFGAYVNAAELAQRLAQVEDVQVVGVE